MIKNDELTKLYKYLQKKESEKNRLEEAIEKNKKRLSKVAQDINTIQTQILTINLTRQNMTFYDLQDLLSQTGVQESEV